MTYIEDVLEAREHITTLNTEKIGEEINAQIVQDDDDCRMEDDELHPEFETHHPDFFDEGSRPTKNNSSSYPRVELWNSIELRSQVRKLDPDQRYVLDLYVKYARDLKLAEAGFCAFPNPPLLVIEGDEVERVALSVLFAKCWKRNSEKQAMIQTNPTS